MKTINPSAVSEDELLLMINQANEQGVIEKQEGEFMQNILRFADKDAYTLMTSRSDIEWLNVRSPHTENAKIVRESGYTKFLVCDDSLDNILGVIRLRDFIENENNKRLDLRKLVTKPIFIPESMNAIKILELFRKKRNYFAIVVDEFSSTQGILTLHDLTENIFGELPDIDDDDDPAVIVRADGSLLVDGMITIEELMQSISIAEFSDNEGDYTTLAGYILSHMEHMPKTGEILESAGYRFEIMDMDKSRIDKVLIQKLF